MTGEKWITKKYSIDGLWMLRDRFAADALIRETAGAHDFAQVSWNLVKLLDEALTARGATPGQNGDKG